ncbi:MAG: hypothetical protein HEEMFOPI_00231 [Holosporales bacterium]
MTFKNYSKFKALSLGVFSSVFLSSITPLFSESISLSTLDYLKNDDPQTKKKLEVAKAIKDNLKKVKENALALNVQSKGTLLVLADFLCPNCHRVFAHIKELDTKKIKINFAVLPLPTFNTELSAQYGLIMKSAFENNSSKFMDVLAQYKTGNKDDLLKLIKSDLQITLDDTSIKDLAKYDVYKRLMSDLSVEFVPMLFYVEEGTKAEDTVVIPLRNIAISDLNLVLEKITKLSQNELSQIRTMLGQ